MGSGTVVDMEFLRPSDGGGEAMVFGEWRSETSKSVSGIAISIRLRCHCVLFTRVFLVHLFALSLFCFLVYFVFFLYLRIDEL